MLKIAVFAFCLTVVYAVKIMLRATFLAFCLAVACADDLQQATVYLDDPTGASGVIGNITFTKTDSGVVINGTVTGLGSGKHGFHIHALGDVTNGCTSTGGHFNPHNVNHGAPEDKVRHVGDLGNIVADSTGVAKVDITDTIIDLEGEHSIIGRAVVVHVGEDDLGKGGYEDSLTTGHAGGRVACGVIGILTI